MKYFEKFLNFKGYGNPSNSYWFVGIEEAKEFSEKIIKGDHYLEPINCLKASEENNDEHRKSQIYQIITKLMVKIYPEFNYEKYWNTKLFRCDGDIFLTNLFPLSKPKIISKFPKHYIDLFGKENLDNYYQITRNKRWKELYKFWHKEKPRITICFGKTYWNEFADLFQLSINEFNDISAELELQSGSVKTNGRIILTKFFTYQRGMMKEDNINKIAAFIKKTTVAKQ